uniref:Eukaryotic translation initiation factor 3 subunit 3 n=1 Tax=Arundo donax TaxID=35708 RepID=A0A0A9GC11_ARUDO
MMKCLREVNVDNNTIGWYQSCLLGSFQTVELIETFVNYQVWGTQISCVDHPTFSPILYFTSQLEIFYFHHSFSLTFFFIISFHHALISGLICYLK